MRKKLICLICIVLVLGLAGTASAAVENSWQGTGDNLWSNSADWSLGHTPARTDEKKPGVARKRVLIITGEDYKGHKWRQTTPVLKSSCEHDPRLLVDVTENLGKLQSMNLSEYDTVVMHFKNYDPQVPGRQGYQKLAEFVQNGGGLVLVHFACGAFQEFKDDFVKLAGCVWNPKLRGHDPFGEFTVHITDHTHPITAGLKDFKTRDELYTCLDGDTPITVLAQATSKVDKKIYPIAFVLTYGRGRVFHCVLGHNADALSNAGAAELFRRGVAWTVGLKPTSEKGTAANAGKAWRFVSIPDFLNVDTIYPQPGWEDTLDYVLKAVKAENPDFVLVAGDLVMGHWWSEADIRKYAAVYYPAWIRRMQAHGLIFYTAIGDHDIGDNPWPPERARLVPLFKQQFRDYLGMPRNGPEHMQGTAFWVKHNNTLIVALDVFEKCNGPQGEINPQVTGKQLTWLETVLQNHAECDHKIIMAHTPILGPVRQWSSSGLMLAGGQESPLWQTMKRHHVDLYLCGEVHAITCIERDGIQQIAHGGLFGYNTRVNYLVGTVYPDRIQLELKEIDIQIGGERLWQVGTNRPLERVEITDNMRQRGFVTVGTLTIDKGGEKKMFYDASGYFAAKHEPKEKEVYRPYGRSAPPRMVP